MRLEASAGDTALELLGVSAYDVRSRGAWRSRHPTPRGVPFGSGLPILMLTAADRIGDKASGSGLGADAHLTEPFGLRQLALRPRALDRRRAYSRPPVREMAGLRLDPFRREVYREGRHVALTRTPCASRFRPCANGSASPG
ncbi:response regulator transcription factor [Deinococcus hopiensis]|uniref:response regulator transcription factor n=1 Tax=Deinococcus hopiensis TaxID=309885 RepID=UPI002481C8B2|nr:hypothetical protein [Deinococcus hopiensis]